LQRANPGLFKDLFALFNRKADVEIRVPDFMLPFELRLNSDFLPEKMVMYIEGEKRGEYTFSGIKVW
jgi:hypothetical protein